jgi:tyrosyl-tRNA synthetase
VQGHQVALLDMLVESGLAVTPKGEVTQGQARKLIQSNAVSVNGEKVSDIEMLLTKDTALHGKYLLVQKGKKNHHLVVFE